MKNVPVEAGLRWTECLAARELDIDSVARADWTAAMAQVRGQYLRATLCSCLARTRCLEALPDAVRLELEDAHRRARVEALAWQRALRLVLPALRDAGIVCAPYKGAALAFLVYEDPAERSMSDIDLWIADADMARACEVMESLGFLRRENPDRPVALQEHYDGEIPFQGHKLGVPLVELHWGVFPGEWLHSAARVDLAAVAARLQEADVFGTRVRVLASHDHFLQVAAHAAVSHQWGQAPVRCLLDLVRLADRGMDWDAMVANARDWHLAGVAAHACELAHALFKREEFAAAAARLATPARRRRLQGHVDARFVLQAGSLSGTSRLSYLLALADRPAVRWRMVARSLWPSRDWLQARYGARDLPVRLRHLAGALKGRF